MADALISTPVAATTGAVAIALIATATSRIKKEHNSDNVALMGVLGAFVFAAQMVNFTIPGTGSSGHIIGGLLLAAMLGSWRGFIALCSVLIVQCLVFADGGLLALGCNIINMAAMSCLVAYPLVFKPIIRKSATPVRIFWASLLSSVVGLELGAFLVSVETVLSGVTALPMGEFLMFMLPIHLVIGICEGIATGLVLTFVMKRDSNMLYGINSSETAESKNRSRTVLVAFAIAAVVLGMAFAWVASQYPDGLEWSIMKLTGATELAPSAAPATAFLPDYESHFSGIIGGVIIMVILWALSVVIFRRKSVKHEFSRSR